MGEAAEVLTFDGSGLDQIPAFKLYLVRASARELDEQDGAMLELLEIAFVRRWVEALAEVDPEHADATAVRLWAESKHAWMVYSPRLTELIRRELQIKAPMAEALPSLVETHLDEILEHLPHLSASARIYVQAFLDLLKRVLASEEARESIGMLDDGNWPDDSRFDEYMALLHGLAVAGFAGGIPDVVTTALASGFWARLRAVAEDDEEKLEKIDAALTSAIRRARSSTSVIDDPSSRGQPSILVLLEHVATGSEQIWAGLPRDGARNLDKYLHGR